MKKILFAALLLSGAGAANAQPASGTDGPRDGVQTRAEAVERVRTLFSRVDQNRDGAVTSDEVGALHGQVGGDRQARRANPDGRARVFERLDINRDNMISRDEWARAEALRGERRAGRGGERGQRVAVRGRMGGAMLRAADLNRDNRVTLQEAEQAALRRFDRADLNRDGQVSRRERQQLRQQWQQRRGQVRG